MPETESPKMGHAPTGEKGTSASLSRRMRTGRLPSSSVHRFEAEEMLLLIHGKPSICAK